MKFLVIYKNYKNPIFFTIAPIIKYITLTQCTQNSMYETNILFNIDNISKYNI